MGRLAPKVGDDCESCAAYWDVKKKPRMKLVRVGVTQNHKQAILLCPYCDGERAIMLAKTAG